jgi:hypothetical protein
VVVYTWYRAWTISKEMIAAAKNIITVLAAPEAGKHVPHVV